jgi:hypothetical protein
MVSQRLLRKVRLAGSASMNEKAETTRKKIRPYKGDSMRSSHQAEA